MMQGKIQSMRSGVIFAVFSIAIVGFGCSSHTASNTAQSDVDHSRMDHGDMDHSTMKSSPNASSAPYDLQFIDTMIAHHQGAVDMAKPCGARAEQAEIKKLCAEITASQQKEIDEMRSWRDKWFAGAAPALNMEMNGMTDSMKGMDMQKLARLKGNDHDLEFIRQMIPHHEGAVAMATEALQRATKDEIKKLAGAIAKAQETEIKQMKEWQTAWSK